MLQHSLLVLVCLATTNAAAFGQILSFGNDNGFGVPRPRVVPVWTIAALSTTGDDKSPAMELRIYRLLPNFERPTNPTADELVPIVRDLFDAPSWQAEGAYLKAVNNRLIVRHRADVHQQVRALLDELQLLERDSLAR
jgi:hypothetical protein